MLPKLSQLESRDLDELNIVDSKTGGGKVFGGVFENINQMTKDNIFGVLIGLKEDRDR